MLQTRMIQYKWLCFSQYNFGINRYGCYFISTHVSAFIIFWDQFIFFSHQWDRIFHHYKINTPNDTCKAPFSLRQTTMLNSMLVNKDFLRTLLHSCHDSFIWKSMLVEKHFQMHSSFWGISLFFRPPVGPHISSLWKKYPAWHMQSAVLTKTNHDMTC